MRIRSDTAQYIFNDIKIGECFAYEDNYYIKIHVSGAVCLETGDYADFDKDDPDIHKVDAEIVIHHVY